MKLNASVTGILLFFCIFSVLYDELRALDAIDQERVKLGLEAAQSAAKAMKALKFVSWATKIGSVAAPLLTAALLVVDIIFSFLGIESPEMILMKAEFKNLNTRLDSFSVQFEEVKKKIDWSTIQLNYEKHESTIAVLNKEREKLSTAKTAEERDYQKEVFIRKFENDFKMATESLYHAMSTESILSDNIFEASAKYTDRHPERSFHFMQGCVQLLLQGATIQSTFIHLKYNNTHADEYFKKLSREKIYNVVDKAWYVYYNAQNDFKNQLKLDVNRIALQNRGMPHKNFVSLFYSYITGKYINRYWFVIVYNEFSGFEKHASGVCGGGNFYRIGGRNIVVASVYKNWANNGSQYTKAWANGVLNSFGTFRQDHNGAKGVLDRIFNHNQSSCHKAVGVVVIGYGHGGFYIGPGSRIAWQLKGVKWCNTNLCWISKIRYYTAIIFG